MFKKLCLICFCILMWNATIVYATSAIPENERIVHEPILPNSYNDKQKLSKFDFPRGKKLGYTPNTLRLKEHEFPFSDLRDDKKEPDYHEMMKLLDEDKVVAVGKNKMSAFFGHYYDLTGTGVFNVIVDNSLIDIGSLAILTDKDGYSKAYEFTQILEVQHAEQEHHYYGKEPLAKLVFDGNGTDMLYLQYCRWDISYGLLIGNVAYRVW